MDNRSTSSLPISLRWKPVHVKVYDSSGGNKSTVSGEKGQGWTIFVDVKYCTFFKIGLM
jgi:hypothetical protein